MPVLRIERTRTINFEVPSPALRAKQSSSAIKGNVGKWSRTSDPPKIENPLLKARRDSVFQLSICAITTANSRIAPRVQTDETDALVSRLSSLAIQRSCVKAPPVLGTVCPPLRLHQPARKQCRRQAALPGGFDAWLCPCSSSQLAGRDFNT